MKVLLDTHVFLWWNTSSQKLSKRVMELFHDPETTLLLSHVSVWEIQIKSQLGKLALPVPLLTLIEQQRNGIELLPITINHIVGIGSLPNLHGDPFDRLLIAQARTENASLITDDHWIRQYAVTTIWS